MEETHKIEARQGNLTALFICALHRDSVYPIHAQLAGSPATDLPLALAILQSCKAHYALSNAGGTRRHHQMGKP